MSVDAVTLDTDQAAAAQRLADLDGRLGRRWRRVRGVYLHGRPGRGKTRLMDRFFAEVRSDRKRRFHFHGFFARLHRAVHETGSIGGAVDALLDGAELVCFDEFHVHDPGDATLVARLLDTLFSRRITLVVTSNYPPERLLPNPLFHHLFVPTIERIREHLDVVSVDGPRDYRTAGGTGGGFAGGAYIVGDCGVRGDVAVPIGHRMVRARRAESGALTVDFARLCGIPVSAADFLELTGRFHRWTVCEVPALGAVDPEWVMRFVHLVDVLYDADLELWVYARVARSELGRDVAGVADLERALSRLGTLRFHGRDQH
ncbi:cell division protein ZapE [Nocardia otitidiscaviarum]|uniref:cell division protein ZapE n=1 Tax=Nocardia otitidiscaviarum TaxID=1823 RepID=UPI00189497C3|nr:cell division protein ZapE [Nocardia otitidiscaviarum]MBF6179218.1 cell division protein ZapE [Nocardia otitidiscaviarum]